MSTVTIKLVALAQEAKMGGSLSSILGQQQVNIIDFIGEFNYKTVKILAGIPIRVKILKKVSDTHITLASLTVSFLFLLEQTLEDKNKIAIEKLFDIIFLFSEFFFYKKLKVIIFEVFSYLLTKKIKIVNIF